MDDRERDDELESEIREEFTQDQAGGGGRQLGGGPSPSDMAAPGGSSGSGGYGNMDTVNRDQPPAGEAGRASPHQSRGERLDELANGGRGPDSVSLDRARDGVRGDSEEGPDEGRPPA